eukprot:Partr_v1_DN24107_c1_g2_i1_m71025 putative PBSP domain-containing protein
MIASLVVAGESSAFSAGHYFFRLGLFRLRVARCQGVRLLEYLMPAIPLYPSEFAQTAATSIVYDLVLEGIETAETEFVLALLSRRCDIKTTLRNIYASVMSILYETADNVPPLKRIKVVIRPAKMSIPAHANFDRANEQGEVVLNAAYIFKHALGKSVTAPDEEKGYYEMMGVLIHEFTHLSQYDNSTNGGGIIEGIADYVRLKSGFGAKHWREVRHEGKQWHCGYSDTAYFLTWLEQRDRGKNYARILN